MSGADGDAGVTRERDLSTAAARTAIGLHSRFIEGDELSVLTGIDFGESSRSLPAIGRLLGAERCISVMGHGGNGITFSAVAAQLIQRELLGLPGHGADLFALAA